MIKRYSLSDIKHFIIGKKLDIESGTEWIDKKKIKKSFTLGYYGKYFFTAITTFNIKIVNIKITDSYASASIVFNGCVIASVYFSDLIYSETESEI